MTSSTQPIRQSKLVQGSPIFYGWVVWFVATIGITATSPGQSFSVSLFIDHYIVDFGLDRSSISALYGLGTFIASLALTWVGRRIDRHGNRFMTIIIAGVFGVVLLACSLVAGPLTILLSFIAIRGLGQGSLGLANTTVIAQWFRKRRGWVMGLSMVAFALVQRFYLPAMQQFIEVNGWRAAWLLVGAMMLIVVVPLLAIFIRDRPEDFGLEPDGDVTIIDDSVPPIIEDNWTLSEALRTPIFWAFTFARMLAGAWGTALIFHQISLFETLGHSAQVAAATNGQAALMTAGFTLLSGYLIDRLRPVWMIVVQMLGLGLATGLVLIMTTDALLIVYTVVFGLFMGAGSVFDGTVWVNMYGRQHQGAIRGFVATSMVMGTSIGPLVFGLSYDYLGGYAPAIYLGMALSIIAIVLALLAREPRKRKPKNDA